MLTVPRSALSEDALTKFSMADKKAHIQTVFDALMRGELVTVQTEGNVLATRPNWDAYTSNASKPGYTDRLNDFKTAVAQLAAANTVDAATGAYMAVTISCVNCHRVIRGF